MMRWAPRTALALVLSASPLMSLPALAETVWAQPTNVETVVQEDTITAVTLWFDKADTDALAAFYRRNVGKQIAIYFDDQLINEPVLRDAMMGSPMYLFVDRPAAQVEDFRQKLEAGEMRVKVTNGEGPPTAD